MGEDGDMVVFSLAAGQEFLNPGPLAAAKGAAGRFKADEKVFPATGSDNFEPVGGGVETGAPFFPFTEVEVVVADGGKMSQACFGQRGDMVLEHAGLAFVIDVVPQVDPKGSRVLVGQPLLDEAVQVSGFFFHNVRVCNDIDAVVVFRDGDGGVSGPGVVFHRLGKAGFHIAAAGVDEAQGIEMAGVQAECHQQQK